MLVGSAADRATRRRTGRRGLGKETEARLKSLGEGHPVLSGVCRELAGRLPSSLLDPLRASAWRFGLLRGLLGRALGGGFVIGARKQTRSVANPRIWAMTVKVTLVALAGTLAAKAVR